MPSKVVKAVRAVKNQVKKEVRNFSRRTGKIGDAIGNVSKAVTGVATNPMVIGGVAAAASGYLPALAAAAGLGMAGTNVADTFKAASKFTGRRKPAPRGSTGPGYAGDDVQGLLNRSYDKKHGDYGDFKLDKSLSGQRAQVYTKDGKAVVVHRGTAGMHDMVTDLKLGLTGSTGGKRFKHAKKIEGLAEGKYGSEHTTAMGHSLGGALAEKTASKTTDVITLNKAAVPSDIGKKIKSNQTDIRTEGDLVSQLRSTQHGGRDVVIPSHTKNPLTEHNTNVMERLESQNF